MASFAPSSNALVTSSFIVTTSKALVTRSDALVTTTTTTTTSKAPVPSSDALVTSSFLLLSRLRTLAFGECTTVAE